MQTHESDTATGSSSVLVVEDEPEIRDALSDYLKYLGYEAYGFENAEGALEAFSTRHYDLLITDMKLPGIDGIELCQEVKKAHFRTSIIVITAYGNVPSALKAIELGADDYILKPFTLESLQLAVKRVFERRLLEKENLLYQARLEQMVETRRDQIVRAGQSIGVTFYKTVYILGSSQECREPFLQGRTERVTISSLRTAQELGWNSQMIIQLLLGAPISDIGKLAVPETILNKPGPLSRSELKLVRNHVNSGVRIVSSLAHFREVAPILRSHHERFDGNGYPDGLRGEEIPATAAVVAIADSFDAMIHKRPWKPAKSYADAIEELKSLSGKAYHPDYIAAFISAVEKHQLKELTGIKPTKQFYDLTLPLLQQID
jgi:putative two-component system response regulator